MEYATQVWIGARAPRAELLNEIVDIGRSKPRGGGLWTSTQDALHGSDWLRWCKEAKYSIMAEAWSAWLLQVAPEARVYEIDSHQDLERLAEQFPVISAERDRVRTPSWYAVSHEYDGVRLTKAGQRATRHSTLLNLDDWDCECTLWFRWAFTAVRRSEIPTGFLAPDLQHR